MYPLCKTVCTRIRTTFYISTYIWKTIRISFFSWGSHFKKSFKLNVKYSFCTHTFFSRFLKIKVDYSHAFTIFSKSNEYLYTMLFIHYYNSRAHSNDLKSYRINSSRTHLIFATSIGLCFFFHFWFMLNILNFVIHTLDQ